MFEAQVAYYLNNYLGKYVLGLDPQSLKISVFKGDVVLRNLKLKAEALADLDLPITVKSGLLGSLTLKVPWTSLGKSPVLVELDRLYILAGPKEDNLAEDVPEAEGDDLDAIERAVKRRRVHDAELAWTSDKSQLDKPPPPSGGRIRAMIDTIIGNLQLSITNVHIRYEDDVSNSGQPFAVGLTLEKLTAHTVDEEGKKAFVTHNPMDMLRKGSQLQRLALYFDVGSELWRPQEEWAKLAVDTWDEFFQQGVSAPSSEAEGAPQGYVLKPIDGQLIYLRRGPNVRQEESQAVQEADVHLNTVSLHLSKSQYQSLQKLLNLFSAFSARQPNSHLRPKGRPRKGPAAVRWWRYAMMASCRQASSQRFSWQQLSTVVSIRKRYVPAYVKCLRNGHLGGDEEIEAMDAELPEHTILVFRRMAHAKVEREKRRSAARAAVEYQKPAQGGGWVGWLWGGASRPAQPQADEDADMRADLNEEEYQKLEEIVSEQEAAVEQGKETQDSLQMEVRLKVAAGSAVLEGEDGTKVVRAGMEGLWLTAQKFPVTLGVTLSLDGVGVSSPEGTVVQTGAQLQHSASMPALDTGVPEIETGAAKAEKQALDVQFIQKPQDQRADTVLDVSLAPSFVTYNPATLQRITSFFQTDEAIDLSALSAQAVAQVEKASQAAQQQLAAALQNKPKLALRLYLEAPKIAVPIASTPDGQGKLTLVADLGTFIVESDTRTAGQLKPEEAALYECLQLTGRDISAYLVDGDFSFASMEKKLTHDGQGGSSLDLAQAESAASVYIPLLERTGISAAVQAARFPYPKLPKLRSQLRLPSLRFYFSPARVRRIMRVLRSALPEAPAKEDPREALAKALWRTQAEHEGHARVLEWGGIGYTTAKWPHRYVVLYRGQIYILDNKASLSPLATQNIYTDRRSIPVAPEHVGGTQHVIAICPPDQDLSKVAESSRCTLLRLSSKDEVDAWLYQLSKSAEQMRELAGRVESYSLGIELDDETASLTSSLSREDLHKVASNLSQVASSPAEAASQQQVPMELQASLGELALYVSGRPCEVWWPPEVRPWYSSTFVTWSGTEHGPIIHPIEAHQADTCAAVTQSLLSHHPGAQQTSSPGGEAAAAPRLDGASGGGVVNVDNEESLLVVRASAGSADASVGGPHLSASVAVGRFEIEDLLVGVRCPAHRYLARSFEAPAAAKVEEEQDEFLDAREDLSVRSPSTASSRSDLFVDAEGPSELAQAAPKVDATWTMEFETWQQGSPDYANVDAELRMRLTTLYFFSNRPTIGALMAIGSDLGHAFSGPQPGGAGGSQVFAADQAPARAKSQEDEDATGTEPSSEAASVGGGQMVLEGGSERTVFRLLMEVDKLEATLLYEDEGAAPLALAHIEDVRFNLHIHPATLRLTASLGNLKAQDGQLPEGHPFRNVCDLRHGTTTSLIEVEYMTHAAEESLSNERMPSGLPFASINAQMHRLDVVFLSRFLFEVLRYINLLLALQPEPLHPKDEALADEPAGKQPSRGDKQSKKEGSKSKIGMVLQLDVSMDAPVITMPRNSDSKDAVEVDLGSLRLHNMVAWRNGSSADDPQAVLVEEDVLALEGLGAVVSVDSRRGDNIIREYNAGTQIRLQRALRDVQQLLPKIAVGIEVPSIKATLSDKEYQLITSIAGDNFNEQQRLPAAAQWLERYYQAPEEEGEPDNTIPEGDETAFDDTVVPHIAMDRAVASVRPDQYAKAPADGQQTAIRVTVNVRKSELEMLHTTNEATGELVPLARFTVGKLWVAFRSMDGGAMALSLSLPHVEGVDLRPGLPEEHRLIIAAAATSNEATPQEKAELEDDMENYGARACFLTMAFEADPALARQKLQLRLQRPTITGEVSFMLAVTKFFVPGFALSGAKPIPFRTHDLRLAAPEFRAEANLWLSPEMRLLADAPGLDDYIYDGQGHRIVLPEGITIAEPLPLIVIGAGKALLLRNVTLVCAASLSACLQLGPGAQLIAHPGENVTKLDGADPSLAMEPDSQDVGFRAMPVTGRASHGGSGSMKGTRRSTSTNVRSTLQSLGRRSTGRAVSQGGRGAGQAPMSFHLDFAALGVGLRFLELADADQPQPEGGAPTSSKALAKPGATAQPQYFVRMLAAYLDVGAHLRMEGDTLDVRAELTGLRLETVIQLEGRDTNPSQPDHGQVVGTVLEPTQIGVAMEMAGPSGQFSLDVSNIRLNLSPDILELALSLQSSVLEPLIQPPAEQPVSKCSLFVKVWSTETQPQTGTLALLDTDVLAGSRGLTFWRPQPPVGYAVLGDCVTAGTAHQPAFQVVAIAVNSGLVTYPVGYKRVASANGLALWEPQPPPGYAALGHVATSGGLKPAATQVVCLHESVAVSCALGECLQLRAGEDAKEAEEVYVWNIDNAGATFVACSVEDGSPPGPFLTLRSPLGMTPAMLDRELPTSAVSRPAGRAVASPRQPPALTRRSYQQFSRTRKELLRTTSSQRLQSRAVDFRRVWWDKGLRNASKEGMSIWRPNPPAGYTALGDCLVSGYDPPRYAVMLQQREQASSGAGEDGAPLLKPPQDYRLTWRDESVRADQALHIWRPNPWPGYVAAGCVASVGEQKPTRALIRCIRADAVSAKSSQGRPVAALPPVGRRTGFKAWATDDRLGTFILTKGEEPPLRDDLWQVHILDAPDDSGSTNSERKEGVDVVVRTGHTSLLLRDALRRPLAEVELGAVQASLRRPTAAVMQFYCGIHISAWSFNPNISAWEPVLESWDLIVKVDANKRGQASQGVDPGTHVTVKSTSEVVHVTLAYAAATTALTSFLEWKDLASGAGGDAYKRQLAAADASSVHTVVDNRLGVAAQMQLDFGDRLETAELPADASTPVLQPLSRPPSRYSDGTNAGPSPEAMLPPMLFIDLRHAKGIKPLLAATATVLAPQELFLSLALTRKGGQPVPGAAWGLRSRAVLADQDKEKVRWNERHVADLPKDEEVVALEVQLWDAAAYAGQGAQLASGTIQLDWPSWQPGSVNRDTVHLRGMAASKDQSAELAVRLMVVRQTGREEEPAAPTDKWTSLASTAGQRAIHIGRHHKGWAIVPPTGLQRSVAAANLHLKQNLAGKADPRSSASASLSVVRIGSGNGIALEGSFQEGVKRETLRSLCQVTNGTRLTLEVALVGAGDDWQQVPSDAASSRSQSMSSTRSRSFTTQGSVGPTIEEEVFENERFLPVMGWSSRNLLPTDRRRFSAGRSQPSSESTTQFPKLRLPDGWEWEGPWELENSGYVDKEGWTYGVDFGSLEYPPVPGNQRKALQHFVRRRRYVRRRRQVSRSLPSLRTTSDRELAERAESEAEETERVVLGSVQPGDSLPLPFGWRSSGQQIQVRPILHPGEARTHSWSVGAGEGEHTLRLGSLDEGAARLAACLPLPDSVRKGRDAAEGEGLAAKLAMSQVWLSLTVEGDPLPSNGGEPLTDWRIVVAPPLVFQNQLPVRGSFLVWEEPRDGDNLVLRQSGEVDSGHLEHIYAVDTRHSVRLQFYPDGYEWSDAEPVLISQGFSSSRAGITGKQQLPEKFQVTRSTGHDAPQDIFINREINMETWLLQGKEGDVDPGAAIAMGSPVLVRLSVPLWIVNATTLPVTALVVPTEPPPKARADTDPGQPPVLNAAESIKLRIVETRAATASARLPAGSRHVMAGSVAMLAFPQAQLQAFRDGDRQHYGLRLKVVDSGWTDPLPIDSGAAASTGESSSKPVMIRARIPQWGSVHEMVARLDLVGSSFGRTLVMRLESHCVISNRLGIPLQLMQWRSDLTAETFDDRAGGGTMVSGSTRGGLPRASPQTPPQPGLRAAIRDPTVDWTSCMDLPPGTTGAPLFWSTGSDKRAVCLRLSPDGTEETANRWSHPLVADFSGSSRKYLAIPVRRPKQQPGSEPASRGLYLRKITTLLSADSPAWELDGPRVARQMKHFAKSAPASSGGGGVEEVEVVVVRYSMELRGPGSMHFVLESVSADPPYLLENRSSQPLQYRQADVAGLPFLPLPPFSAAGFAWQVPGHPEKDSQPAAGSSGTWQHYHQPHHQVEIMDSYGQRNYGRKYSLDALPPQSVSDDVSQVMQHASATAEQPRLPIATGKELQVTVRDVDQEITERAGLQSLGTQLGIGRGGVNRALRLTQAPVEAPASLPVATANDGIGNALYVAVTIAAIEVSLVDHTPEEILVATATGLTLDYAAGIGPDCNFISLRAGANGVQIDDQLATSRFPVVLTPAAVDSNEGGVAQPLLQTCVVCQPGSAQGQVYYPYIAFRVSRPLQVAVTETLVWRVVEMLERLNLGALAAGGDSSSVAASSDSPVRISLVNMSDLAAFVSFRGDTLSRPRWAAAMGTLSWGLDMANFEAVPVRVQGFEMENVGMLWSVFISHVVRLIQGQLMTVALSFLRNFGFFSGTSGVLGALSAGVGSLAGDREVDKERQKDRREREIGGFGEGVAEGGQSLASGFRRGFTGLVNKPLQGAKQAGVGGFFSGVGRGLVGAVANPVSGGLDALSSTFEGIDAASSSLLGRARPQAARRSRLPRAIGGDRKLLPFRRPPDQTEKQARIEEIGQSLLRGARDRDTSALSILKRRRRRSSRTQDAYEDHFLLPEDRVVVLTNRALTCLLAPGFAAVHAAAEQGRLDTTGAPDIPAAELRWAVLWKDVLAMELARSHRDLRFPDRLHVHRKGKPGQQDEQPLAHELRCFPNTRQAEMIKALAFKIRNKYYIAPQSEAQAWEHRPTGLEPEDAEARGLPPQQLPPTMPALEYRRVWHVRKVDANTVVSVWHPVGPPGYQPLGDVISMGLDPPGFPVQVFRHVPGEARLGQERPILAPPEEFHLVWRCLGRNPVTLWEPVPPAGYRAMGTVATPALEVPSPNDVLCVREDQCGPAAVYDSCAWRWEPPAGGLSLQRMKPYYPEAWKCSLWQVDNQFNTFLALRTLHKPPFGAALDFKPDG